MTHHCAIIGAGPAGIISAIQLKRSGFNVILFEKNKIGGLLRNANKIENYLGFTPGISGKELIEIFTKQLHTFKIKPITEEVSKIRKGETFEIDTEKDSYKAHTVIIATGTTPKKLGIPGEKELQSKKVFYEIADLSSAPAGKEVLIIGGGDAAFDYAIHLHKKGQKPSIIMRNKPSCLHLLQVEAQKKNIPYFEDIKPLRIDQDADKVNVDCGQKTFKTDLVLIAAGRQPTHPVLELENKEGLYFAGDVKNGNYRQIHIATGSAMSAAMKVQKSLYNDHHPPNRK